jgi:lipopolysaccharide biosynthesis regulator YciM
VALAHFCCELVDAAVAQGDLDAAARHLADAFAADRRSLRATLLAGDLAARRGEGEESVRHWLRLNELAPEYLPLVADRLSLAMDALGRRDEALNLLRRSLLDTPSVDLLEVTCRRIADWEGAAAAETLLRDELKRHPSLLGFEKLLALRSAAAKGDAELDLLRNLIQSQTRRIARYRCGKCGFRAREFHWQCPGCTSWDSYPPRRVEELDAAG